MYRNCTFAAHEPNPGVEIRVMSMYQPGISYVQDHDDFNIKCKYIVLHVHAIPFCVVNPWPFT